jgi:hypothetical protein
MLVGFAQLHPMFAVVAAAAAAITTAAGSVH